MEKIANPEMKLVTQLMVLVSKASLVMERRTAQWKKTHTLRTRWGLSYSDRKILVKMLIVQLSWWSKAHISILCEEMTYFCVLFWFKTEFCSKKNNKAMLNVKILKSNVIILAGSRNIAREWPEVKEPYCSSIHISRYWEVFSVNSRSAFLANCAAI